MSACYFLIILRREGSDLVQTVSVVVVLMIVLPPQLQVLLARRALDHSLVSPLPLPAGPLWEEALDLHLQKLYLIKTHTKTGHIFIFHEDNVDKATC